MTGGTLAFAFGAGLTTFAAPCVFPLLPGYVGYYAERHGRERGAGPLGDGLAAAAGVLSVFAGLTLAVYLVDSRVLGSIRRLEPVAGGLLVALGLATLTGHAPSIRVALPRRRSGLAGTVGFGAVYAVAAAGCTVSILLAVVAQALAMAPLSGAAVVGAYALGVALPMVGITLATGYGYGTLTDGTPVAPGTLTRLAGVVMLCAGAVQLWAGLSVGW